MMFHIHRSYVIVSFSFFSFFSFVFFFNDTATTEIYTLSLHDALPISGGNPRRRRAETVGMRGSSHPRDRKSTRLNSSHLGISYAVFCLQKKKQTYSLHAQQQKSSHHPSTETQNTST